MAVTRNDLEALKASYAGLRSTARRLLELEHALDPLERTLNEGGDASAEPPAELIRAATAHAIAAGAFSGLLHRLFTTGGAPPASPEGDDQRAEA